MVYPTEKEFISGMMATTIRDNGRPIRCMERVFFAMQQVKFMKDSFGSIKEKARGFLLMNLETDTRVYGITMKEISLESTTMRMETYMKVNS